jgi:hypothetical protein
MIYQAILKIGGKEIPLLYYSYRCHIRHCDDPNLGRIIQLHIQVCEETGNREYLPIEGDLITLMFECSGDEHFFYDWLNEGAMHYGEIHFIYNESEVVDIFRFWDCFCLKIEESMSAGNSPMVMTVYLSPGIIKRNNLEAREKEWKVNDPYNEFREGSNIDFNGDNDIVENKQSVSSPVSEDDISNFITDEFEVQDFSEEDIITAAINAYKRAIAIQEENSTVKSMQNKTFASDSIVAVSGWSNNEGFTQVSPKDVFDYCVSIEYIPSASGAFDQISRGGFKGKFNCSHAEKKILCQKPNEIIGVTRIMCRDCKKFCKKQAIKTNQIVIVVDPKFINIFTPDGIEKNLITSKYVKK